MKVLINPSTTEKIKIQSLGIQIRPEEEYEIPAVMVDQFSSNGEIIGYIQAGTLLVSDGTTTYTDIVQAEVYFRNRFGSQAVVADDTGNISVYDNIITLDSPSGTISTTFFYTLMSHARELYNDPSNPLHLDGFTPLLGPNGSLSDLADRTLNLENVYNGHATTISGLETSVSDLGTSLTVVEGNISTIQSDVTTLQGNVSTLQTDVAALQAGTGGGEEPAAAPAYMKPTSMLIYYGWINSFNSGVNGWSNENVAKDMARYGIVVLGSGMADPGHGDYANTTVIIPRLKELNPNTLIFGYATANQTLSNFQAMADQWNNLGIHGIFLDEAGYDYGVDRTAFNAKVDYVHGLSNATLAFANAWNPDHVLTIDNDTNFPNSTFNPSGDESHLTADDWYLLESFAVNTAAYTGTNGYASASDWHFRGNRAAAIRANRGIKLAAVDVIDNASGSGQTLFNFAFTSAMMFALDAHGSSDHFYGAGSASVNHWTRPSVLGLSDVYRAAPPVWQDASTGTLYHRFVDFGHLTVNFASGSQTSDIAAY